MNPFMLDYFFLARGYGFGLAFEMLSLLLLARRKVYLSLAAAALAVIAHLTFFNFFVPLLAIGLWMVRRDRVVRLIPLLAGQRANQVDVLHGEPHSGFLVAQDEESLDRFLPVAHRHNKRDTPTQKHLLVSRFKPYPRFKRACQRDRLLERNSEILHRKPDAVPFEQFEVFVSGQMQPFVERTDAEVSDPLARNKFLHLLHDQR